MVRVKVVRLQTQEFVCGLIASPTNDLRHGNLAVVVTNPVWHATEEIKRADMPFLERLGAFAGKCLTEKRIAIR